MTRDEVYRALMRNYKLTYREVYQMTSFEHQQMINALAEQTKGTRTFKTEAEYLQWQKQKQYEQRRNSKTQR